MRGFLRAEVQKVLCEHLPTSCHVHFSKRLASYTRLASGVAQLQFSDGTQATCNLIVGCDGIKSAVRGTLCHELAKSLEKSGNPAGAKEAASHVDPQWSGTTSYRTLISSSALESVYPGHRVLKRPMIVSQPSY